MSIDQSRPRRIDEERVCIDALGHVLQESCGCREFRAHKEENDPPDFTVSIDGVEYPAEVTSIVSAQAHSVHCREFANAIQARAIVDGPLVGTYALCISQSPQVPTPSSRAGREVVDAAAAFIDATRLSRSKDEIELVRDTDGQIRLKKMAETGSAVGVYWEPIAMWEGETQGELTTFLQRAISDKIGKLQRVGISTGSALLLLYDAYGHGDVEDACIAIERVEGVDWFHSVFWAASFTNRKNSLYPDEPGRDGAFLFSRAPTWHRVGATSGTSDT